MGVMRLIEAIVLIEFFYFLLNLLPIGYFPTKNMRRSSGFSVATLGLVVVFDHKTSVEWCASESI